MFKPNRDNIDEAGWSWMSRMCKFCPISLRTGLLTELVLSPKDPALSRARATMTLLFSPAQWTTIWLWESFRLACRMRKQLELKLHFREKARRHRISLQTHAKFTFSKGRPAHCRAIRKNKHQTQMQQMKGLEDAWWGSTAKPIITSS